MTDGAGWYSAGLAGAAVVSVIFAICAWRFGTRAATAIAIASLCVIALTFGTCAAAFFSSTW
jgi:mannose/fructose/N-acetylgalactosamine-specific phosphotransferase system component IIC